MLSALVDVGEADAVGAVLVLHLGHGPDADPPVRRKTLHFVATQGGHLIKREKFASFLIVILFLLKIVSKRLQAVFFLPGRNIRFSPGFSWLSTDWSGPRSGQLPRSSGQGANGSRQPQRPAGAHTYMHIE